MPLTVTRHEGERVLLVYPDSGTGKDVLVWVEVHGFDRGRCKLSFTAPREVRILREEIAAEFREEKHEERPANP